MKVYHFLNEEFGLKDLREKRLMISTISGLNDPFEFFPVELTDVDFRKTIKNTRKVMDGHLGLVCFSRNWKNPVQWTHYADRHRGICLGFEVPDKTLHEITYVKDRLKVADTDQKIKTLLTYKFSDWKYEDEVRLFEKLENDEDEDEIYYKDFCNDLKLVEVIVGANADISKATIKSLLREYTNDVEYFKARAAFNSFEVIRNKNDSLWI